MGYSRLLTLAAAFAASTLAPAIPAAAADCGGAHTVRAGDTLSRIASDCGTSVDALLETNPDVSPSSLSIGRELTVPGGDAAEQTAATRQSASAITLEGWIVNGRRCARLATADGEEYGVVSPDLSFVSGSAVAVEGRIVDNPTCPGPRTLLVTEITTAEL